MKPTLSVIPEPDRSVEARKPLTKRQRAQMMLDQGGICGCGCGGKLGLLGEPIIDEHLKALGLFGTNERANRSLWRGPCSAAKTYGVDLPTMAKSERQGGRKGQSARREKNGSQIQSRGFQKGVKREWGSRPFPKQPKGG